MVQLLADVHGLWVSRDEHPRCASCHQGQPGQVAVLIPLHFQVEDLALASPASDGVGAQPPVHCVALAWTPSPPSPGALAPRASSSKPCYLLFCSVLARPFQDPCGPESRFCSIVWYTGDTELPLSFCQLLITFRYSFYQERYAIVAHQA